MEISIREIIENGRGIGDPKEFDLMIDHFTDECLFRGKSTTKVSSELYLISPGVEGVVAAEIFERFLNGSFNQRTLIESRRHEIESPSAFERRAWHYVKVFSIATLALSGRH